MGLIIQAAAAVELIWFIMFRKYHYYSYKLVLRESRPVSALRTVRDGLNIHKTENSDSQPTEKVKAR